MILNIAPLPTADVAQSALQVATCSEMVALPSRESNAKRQWCDVGGGTDGPAVHPDIKRNCQPIFNVNCADIVLSQNLCRETPRYRSKYS